jgi:hypothetical protein
MHHYYRADEPCCKGAVHCRRLICRPGQGIVAFKPDTTDDDIGAVNHRKNISRAGSVDEGILFASMVILLFWIIWMGAIFSGSGSYQGTTMGVTG